MPDQQFLHSAGNCVVCLTYQDNSSFQCIAQRGPNWALVEVFARAPCPCSWLPDKVFDAFLMHKIVAKDQGFKLLIRHIETVTVIWFQVDFKIILQIHRLERSEYFLIANFFGKQCAVAGSLVQLRTEGITVQWVFFHSNSNWLCSCSPKQNRCTAQYVVAK